MRNEESNKESLKVNSVFVSLSFLVKCERVAYLVMADGEKEKDLKKG